MTPKDFEEKLETLMNHYHDHAYKVKEELQTWFYLEYWKPKLDEADEVQLIDGELYPVNKGEKSNQNGHNLGTKRDWWNTH